MIFKVLSHLVHALVQCVRGCAVVERSPTQLKVQGSNLGWNGQGLANEIFQFETATPVT